MTHSLRPILHSSLMEVRLHSAPSTGICWSEEFLVESPRLVIPYCGAIALAQAGRKYFCPSAAVLTLDASAPYRMRRIGATSITSIVIVPNACSLNTTSHALPMHQWLYAVQLISNDGATDRKSNELAIEEFCIGLIYGGSQSKGGDHRVDTAARRAVAAAYEFIAANATQSLRLDQIARAVDVSPFHLARVFKQVTGSTMHQSKLQCRIANAVVRLKHGDSDLTALALDLGFSSHAHFTKAFRERVGCTPSMFRWQSMDRKTRTIMQ